MTEKTAISTETKYQKIKIICALGFDIDLTFVI